jgi:cytochrome d ubiquinol oxidase subunit II
MRERSGALAARLAPVVLVVTAGWAIWAQVAYSVAWTWAVVAVAAAALVAVVLTTRARREGWAFVWSAVVVVAAVVLIFGSMFPDVMPAFDPANSLDIRNASSTDYTLTIMTWVAVLLVPVVLLYQGWTYWVFRKRISADHIPEHVGLTFTAAISRKEKATASSAAGDAQV